MPLYEFRCRSCETVFEELVRVDEVRVCPECGTPDPERLPSSVSPPHKFGLRGAEARRSNAIRQAREERRREQRAERRACRPDG